MKKNESPSKPLSTLSAMRKLLLFTLFLAAIAITHAQNLTITGRVIRENGQPVQGGSVLVKGSTHGTTTDDNGNFRITAANDATLVFSGVGFESREVPVNGRSVVNTTLASAAGSLGEVVVVGYGTQRKRDVTGAVVRVGGESLREMASPNFADQLKGRTAGVNIISNGATPGASNQIRIRGNRSLAKTSSEADGLDNPLIVLDGIPYGGSLNDINPEDISNLEILKDASATAIYGSRGSGGVILITTKRGRTGKASLSYDGYIGFSEIMGKLDVFNGEEYAQFKKDAATYNRTGWPTSAGTTSYPLTAAEQDALSKGISTDWQDLIYQRGLITNHQLSLSGGNDDTQFGLGAGYFNEEGIIPNQNFQRFSLRATIDHRIGRRIRIGLNTLNTLSYTNTPGGAGVPGGLVRTTPLAAPYNEDGSVNLQPQVGSIDAAAISPLTLITREDAILARNRRLRTFNSLYGELMIVDGLKYRLNVGLDFRQDNGSGYNGPGTYTNNNLSQAASNASISNAEAWTYTIENLLMYDKTFKQKHRVGATALFSVQKDHFQNSGFNAVGIPADYILNSNFALANAVTANTTAGTNSFFERGLVSYMGRVNYAYDDRYLFTATVRTDGSSALSPGHQYFTYPAFSVGWNMSNETFMRNVEFVSNLKFRGGWGKTSNQGVPPYATLGLLTASTYNFGQGSSGQQPAYVVTTLANSSLKWQSTDQWNIGIDFGLFNSRIMGSVDIYEQKTKDILLDFNLPQSNGAATTRRNLGRTSGHGLEINLTTVNIRSAGGFTWSTDLNFFFNREKVEQLQNENIKQDISNGWFVGEPLTVIYDLKKIGIWQLDDSSKGTLAQQLSPVQYPGQIRIEDLNGDNKIDAADRQILGNFQPRWEAGMTNRFSYKNFDLSFLIFARMGMQVLVPYVTADGGGNGFPFFMQGRNNQVKVNYWTRTNPTNGFPAPDAGTDRMIYSSTLGYHDGSFIKMRYINFGYTFPSKTVGKAVRSLRLYVNITNPFVLYSPFVRDGLGPDPEGNGYGGAVGTPAISGSVPQQGRQISVNANNPAVKQFIFGVNVQF
ncbi:TonB-dependent receptor [Pollutibacter soli]|uniref:SusC/RagA family TonB-linked outer membrane protein n=1 Tax=Pollutibacter soli TaxID=3034157 RepID=UPI0030138E38